MCRVPGYVKEYINPHPPYVPMVMNTPHDDDDVKPAMRAVFGKTTQPPLERLFCDRPTDGVDQ
jgi:hypothetical protein